MPKNFKLDKDFEKNILKAFNESPEGRRIKRNNELIINRSKKNTMITQKDLLRRYPEALTALEYLRKNGQNGVAAMHASSIQKLLIELSPNYQDEEYWKEFLEFLITVDLIEVRSQDRANGGTILIVRDTPAGNQMSLNIKQPKSQKINSYKNTIHGNGQIAQNNKGFIEQNMINSSSDIDKEIDRLLKEYKKDITPEIEDILIEVKTYSDIETKKSLLTRAAQMAVGAGTTLLGLSSSIITILGAFPG